MLQIGTVRQCQKTYYNQLKPVIHSKAILTTPIKTNNTNQAMVTTTIKTSNTKMQAMVTTPIKTSNTNQAMVTTPIKTSNTKLGNGNNTN